MKNYQTKQELIADFKKGLRHNVSTEKYILDRLDNPRDLIDEFKAKPYLKMILPKGEWFIWKNQQAKIEGEFVQVEDLLNKLSLFLEIDRTLSNASEAVNYAMGHVGNTYINKDLLPEIKELVEKVRNGELNRALELRKFNAHPEGSGSDNDVLLMEAIAEGRSQALQSWMTDLIMAVEENQGGAD